MRPTTLLLPLLSLILTPTHAQINYCAGNKATLGYCTATTFIDKTTSTRNAPTTSQCQEACRGVTQDPGEWGLSVNSDTPRLVVGSACGFNIARAPGEPSSYSFSMDNQDIIDIYDEVSLRFGPLHAGRVAAEGIMVCEGKQVRWFIN